MIWQRSGSLIMRTASVELTHLRVRARFSFHWLAMRSTRSGNTRTSHGTSSPEVSAGFEMGDCPGQSGFLAGLARRGLAQRLVCLRPTLGKHPSAGIAAGDQHDLDAVAGIAPG